MTAAASHLNLDSSGHPDIEAISDYVEDLLAPQAAAELTAHLTGCAECRESRDALDEIRALLGQTEFPSLPGDIALRIDAALAAEAEAGLTPTTAPTPATGTEPAQTAPETARRTMAPPRSPKAAAGPSRPAGRGPDRQRGRLLRRAALGVAAFAACGLIITAVAHSHGGLSSGSSKSAALGGSAAGPAAGTRFTAFSEAGFTQQIQQLLSAPASQSSEPGAQGTGQQPFTVSNGPSEARGTLTAPSCVLAAVDRPGQQPLTVSLGSYQGAEVYALVYPDAADPAHSVNAFLVNASCVTAPGQNTPLLLSRTVPRP